MKIALVQMVCKPGAVAENLSAMLAKIHAAAAEGAKLVVLPEMADTGYEMTAIAAHAEGGESRRVIGAAAKQAGVHVVAGIGSRVEGKLYNTAVAFSPAGEVLAEYRKVHLFTSQPIHEERWFAAGDRAVTFQLGPWRCGLMICYDVRFPELARTLVLAGANLLIVPTAWPAPRIAHWQALTVARAIENQCYLIGANRVGTDGPTTFGGSSTCVDPQGNVTRADPGEQLLTADIELQKVLDFRSAIPCAQHRRPDVYRT
jgi:predicted amidohydrolase